MRARTFDYDKARALRDQGHSYIQIGRILGGSNPINPSTVMNACRPSEPRGPRWTPEYLEACKRHGQEPVNSGQWSNHHRHLQAIERKEQFEGGPRLTKAEMFAYWREVLTPDQIQSIGLGEAFA